MIVLRPYQGDAVDAVYRFLRTRDDNPCVVIPTAGGKTPILATICRDAVQLWNGRVLILAHVKELLEQAAEKLRSIAPDVPVGIYSAGLRRRDLGYAVTIAGIQSVYQKACDVGPVDLIIIDECHLVPEDGEGMYRQLLGDLKVINPQVRIIGLTATPFRMKSGMICAPENILNEICYEISVRELIVQGYLCPLRTKAGTQRPNCDQLHVRGGEFVAAEVENLMDDDALVHSACREIIEHTTDRNSVLIFASGVKHGDHIVRILQERYNAECGFISGETLPFYRAETLRRFRAGDLKYLCNVNVLTTGFDAPNIDCVAIVRPTLSPGLWYQMVGRAFRLHPGKTDALILDFGGNALRHGPVDQLRVKEKQDATGVAPAKECPHCHELIAAGYGVCPQCGYEFPPPDRGKHDATASSASILSEPPERTEYDVSDVMYSVHTKRGAAPDAPRTLRVDYRVAFNHYVSEWVCVEHSGYARQRAEAWWRRRSLTPIPTSAEEAVQLAEAGALAPALGITVERVPGDKFDRIVAHRLGEIPAAPETAPGDSCPDCGEIERAVVAGTGPHAGKEICARCGRWMRHVNSDEYEEYAAAEVPF